MQVEILLTHESIQTPEQETKETCGAVVEFHGIVRGSENGQSITALEYEAYESMAEKQLQKIITELSNEYVCHQLVLIHRLGVVQVGEASLYLRVVSKHRAEAFGLCQKLIDRMKQDVPIWKSVLEKASTTEKTDLFSDNKKEHL